MYTCLRHDVPDHVLAVLVERGDPLERRQEPRERHLSVPLADGGRVEGGGRGVGLAVEEEEVGELPVDVVVAEGVHLRAKLGEGEENLSERVRGVSN